MTTTKILTFLIAILLLVTITSCEKSDDASSEYLSLNGTIWDGHNGEFIMRLQFVNDSLCTIMTGPADGIRLGTNSAGYIYKRAYGIDLMMFNNDIVEYTARFIDVNTLAVSRSVNNISQEPVVLNKSK